MVVFILHVLSNTFHSPSVMTKHPSSCCVENISNDWSVSEVPQSPPVTFPLSVSPLPPPLVRVNYGINLPLTQTCYSSVVAALAYPEARGKTLPVEINTTSCKTRDKLCVCADRIREGRCHFGDHGVLQTLWCRQTRY